ncbi:response regulator [Ilyomonas limi]|uniref:histidine kinase n=1 Tax=Ilyomonas limi TaxID=2575867 RepID=A0A4U3KSP3_9BACT|nr:response regulator [Ilyomonas limi]
MAILLLLLLNLCQLQSQDIEVKYLGIENGLSNNTVITIFQDHNGFMWFGTYDGLNRFDGYEFKVFRNIIDDSTSIASNNINCIGEDASHNIWVGGQKEINIYNPITARFSTPSYTFSNGITRQRIADNVMSVQLVRNNAMLVGTQHNGLFCFDNSTTNGKQILLNNKRLANYYVTAIKYDTTTNSTYVLVQNEGLFVYDAQKQTLHLKNNLLKQANCISVSSNGKLWIGDNSGLYQLDNAINTLSASLVPYKGPVVNLCEDKKGTLWIATDGGGVWLLPAGQNNAVPLSTTNAKNKSLINSNAVYAIYEDKEERKWIGTLRGGVNVIEPQQNKFEKVIYQPVDNTSAVENFILSFCEDEKHNVWIGTDGAGLRYWNRVDNTFKNFVHDSNNPNTVSSNFITNIINDDSRGVWLSTWFGGINYYNTNTGLFQHYTCFNPVTKTINNNVWTLLKDSHKRLWACAVRNGGLYLFNQHANTFDMFDNRLAELQCLTEDADGNIWGGDYTSLYKIDTVNKKHQVYSIGYAVRSMYEDKKKNFWIGTQEGGLLRFNRQNGTFERFTTTDGLPHNTVLRILEDGKGNLWLSTYNGLSRFDPAKKTFRNFSQSDGLQSNQFSFNGALALNSGELLFGGIKGFNVFYPQKIAEEKREPPLFLSTLKVNSAPVQNNLSYIKEKDQDVIKKVIIPYDEAALSFDYLGLDYADAANINYAYYLQGWDKNWNYVKNTRTATYSRLREGDYIFKVKVSYADGIWSNPQQLLYITVLPPWYRTWWAYSLYVLLCMAAIYLYALYKSRQAKLHYEIQLAHLETQKEKELNEKKIAFFTNISHEFRTPLSLIINPIKDLLNKPETRTGNAELKVVYRNAQRLLRLVDQLLLFKKADAETEKLHIVKLNFYSLCNDVFSCFTEQARIRKIKYELQSNTKKLMLHADREKLEIALFNVLSNAFKYTPDGGEIIFIIEEKEEQVRVSISDTGTGISETEGKKLFEQFYQIKNASSKSGFGIGLYLVKKFVEAHEGTVTYKSLEGKGTTFTIVLNKIVTETAAPSNNESKQVAASDAKRTDESALINAPAEIEANTNIIAEEEQLQITPVSAILSELSEEMAETESMPAKPDLPQELASDKQTLLIIDDDNEIRNYLVSIFAPDYKIYEANCAEDGIKLAQKHLPDLIISDIVMKGLNGLDLCRTLKEDKKVSHIPIILLTGTTSDEMQLQGMESGADDYIKKPFDKDILAARVKSILKRRNILQSYFYNEITFGSATFKISDEYKEFLQACMRIIENHLTDDQFSIKTLATEIGMSHSNLYKKIKAVSGQSVNAFIRFIRLRKAAEVFINTENNVNETAAMVGFNDIKYFRSQFVKLFGVNPSEYIKKYRKPFHNNLHVEGKMLK